MKKELIPVALLMFVNMLGFTITIPVLPFIVRQFNQSDVVYGLLLSSYAAFQFIGAPIIGTLSDKYGRRPMLLISQFGTLMSWVVFGLAYFVPNILVLSLPLPLIIIALSRVVDGLTGGNVSVANAYLSDITTPQEKAQAFGLIGAVIGLALIIGPAIGGFSSSTQFTYLGTAVVAFVISLITLIMMIKFLKESLPKKDRDNDVDLNLFRQLNIWAKVMKYKENKFIMTLFQMRLLFNLAMSAYISIIVLFAIDLFGFDEKSLGLFLLFVGGYMIFNQVVMIKQFISRIGEEKTLMLGLFFMGLGLILITLTSNLLLFLVFYYVMNLGIALSISTFKSLFSKGVSRKKQGDIMGIDESAFAFTTAIAPMIAGFLYISLAEKAFWIMSFIVLLSFAVVFIRFGKIELIAPKVEP